MLYFYFYMYAEEKFKSYFGLKIAPSSADKNHVVPQHSKLYSKHSS